jgi:hypothetical protein
MFFRRWIENPPLNPLQVLWKFIEKGTPSGIRRMSSFTQRYDSPPASTRTSPPVRYRKPSIGMDAVGIDGTLPPPEESFLMKKGTFE